MRLRQRPRREAETKPVVVAGFPADEKFIHPDQRAAAQENHRQRQHIGRQLGRRLVKENFAGGAGAGLSRVAHAGGAVVRHKRYRGGFDDLAVGQGLIALQAGRKHRRWVGRVLDRPQAHDEQAAQLGERLLGLLRETERGIQVFEPRRVREVHGQVRGQKHDFPCRRESVAGADTQRRGGATHARCRLVRNRHAQAVHDAETERTREIGLPDEEIIQLAVQIGGGEELAVEEQRARAARVRHNAGGGLGRIEVDSLRRIGGHDGCGLRFRPVGSGSKIVQWPAAPAGLRLQS